MSMEQRITTLEEVSQLIVAALRAFEESMRRYEAAEARREEAVRELSVALQRQDEAVQALFAYLPITQAEIVRLDNRIDTIEGA